MIIEKDEMNDFQESISRNRFNVNDFEITGEDISNPDPDGTYYVKTKITVTRKSNGKQKIYHGGHGTKWNNDFENDLKSGIFDFPN